MDVSETAKENPYSLSNLLNQTVFSFARKASGKMNMWVACGCAQPMLRCAAAAAAAEAAAVLCNWSCAVRLLQLCQRHGEHIDEHMACRCAGAVLELSVQPALNAQPVLSCASAGDVAGSGALRQKTRQGDPCMMRLAAVAVGTAHSLANLVLAQ